MKVLIINLEFANFACLVIFAWILGFYPNHAQQSSWTFSNIVNVPKRPTTLQERFSELVRAKQQRSRSEEESNDYNEDECENLNQSQLMRRMKDEGDYNPKYMATSIEEAADKFEDLSARKYLPVSKSVPDTCDEDCVRTLDEFISQLKSLNKLPPDDQIILKPDMSNAQPKMSNAAMASFNRLKFNRRQFDQFSNNGGGGLGGMPQISSPTFGGGSFFGRHHNRGKRFIADQFPDSIPTSVLDKDIGQGTTVYCWKAGDQGQDKNKNLHHTCTACRSMKVLSDQHFPKYLNQVECGGGDCLMGQGVCAKQYIQVKVLKNNGTKQCQKWVKETLRLSVCCDCMLKRESTLYQEMMLRNNKKFY